MGIIRVDEFEDGHDSNEASGKDLGTQKAETTAMPECFGAGNFRREFAGQGISAIEYGARFGSLDPKLQNFSAPPHHCIHDRNSS